MSVLTITDDLGLTVTCVERFMAAPCGICGAETNLTGTVNEVRQQLHRQGWRRIFIACMGTSLNCCTGCVQVLRPRAAPMPALLESAPTPPTTPEAEAPE